VPRACQLITRLVLGGAQRIALETALHLRAAGWESELWCGPQSGPEGTLLEEARARGQRVRIIPGLLREIAPLSDLRAHAHLRRTLRDGRFDVVHTHSSKAGILGRLAAGAARVPLRLHTIHGWATTPDATRFTRGLYTLLERRAAREAHALIAVSEAVRDAGLARGIGEPSQYRVIHGGISIPPAPDDAQRRRARETLGLPHAATVIGTIGRLDDAKDPLGAFAALTTLVRADPALRIVFIGDGHLRTRLAAAIAAAGLGERVTLAGLRRDAVALTAAFDVFFLASRWEGFPLAVIEAMAMGLPVVAYDVAGVREAVREGETGRLAAPGATRVWAARLAELCVDPQRRAAMGAAGRVRVCARFRLERMLEETLALYEGLMR
jgi:glycosyltransferase involved in cell wall biosynthesis